MAGWRTRHVLREPTSSRGVAALQRWANSRRRCIHPARARIRILDLVGTSNLAELVCHAVDLRRYASSTSPSTSLRSLIETLLLLFDGSPPLAPAAGTLRLWSSSPPMEDRDRESSSRSAPYSATKLDPSIACTRSEGLARELGTDKSSKSESVDPLAAVIIARRAAWSVSFITSSSGTSIRGEPIAGAPLSKPPSSDDLTRASASLRLSRLSLP